MRLGGHDRRVGFTLLEVILALALTLMLMAAVMAMYFYSNHLREDVVANDNFIQAEQMIMNHMTGELRSAKVYPFTKTGLAGGSSHVRMVTTELPGRSAWAIPDATQTPPPPETDVQLVTYRLRVEPDESGQDVVLGMERVCQKILAPRVEDNTDNQAENRTVDFLTDQIHFLRLRYFDGSNWVDSWSGGDLPLAVEIILGAQPLPEDCQPEDYPYQTYERVVYLPGSTHTLSGAAVQGLDNQDQGDILP